MPNEAPNVVEVESLTAGYNGQAVVEDVSFAVAPGEIFFIVGTSGCGKSTVLKHIIGLHDPIAGRVSIEGRDVSASEGEARSQILRRIGVLYQTGALFGSMTLAENVRLPLDEFTDLPREAKDLIVRMKLREVDLEDAGDQMPGEVSGGMRKRAALARAMALDPPILFLDEPSAGLDPITSAELDDLIVRVSRNLGITVVIVSHELASIFGIADRVVMLDKEARGVVAAGRPEELRDDRDNEKAWRFFHRLPDGEE